jgi:hypothetical protein
MLVQHCRESIKVLLAPRDERRVRWTESERLEVFS